MLAEFIQLLLRNTYADAGRMNSHHTPLLMQLYNASHALAGFDFDFCLVYEHKLTDPDNQ